MTFSVGKHIVS